MTGKTITQFLVDGSPTGIKTIELSNWIGKSIQIPRAKLKEAKNRPEMSQPAIYFLFGQDEEWNDRAYIGEAENVISRLATHDTGKDFWDTVIVCISKDNNLTKADVKFLEARAIERAKKTWRYILENSVEPIPNNLPEYQIATMNEFLENIDLLISAIGFPIIKESIINHKKNQIIYSTDSRWSIANGIYTEDGFIVLKWSRWPREVQPNVIKYNFYANRHRPKLLEQGVLEIQWDEIVFAQDYVFSSPSGASDVVVGASTNGWTYWKTKDWKTLDEIERKNLK